MPNAPARPCTQPGCGRLTFKGRCDQHRKQQLQQQEERRGSRHERGYTSEWYRYRAQYLRAHALCVSCEADGRVVAATVVDHIRPHKGDMGLFWDSDNHQALCEPCHNRKTATQDGGFGNPRR